MKSVKYSEYYQAKIEKKTCILFSAILRSFENLAFARTVDKEKSIFEFFVSSDQEQEFVEIINYFCELGFASDFNKKKNRLKDSADNTK